MDAKTARANYLSWLMDSYPWTAFGKPDGEASLHALREDYTYLRVVEFPVAELAGRNDSFSGKDENSRDASENALVEMFKRQPLLTLSASAGQGKSWFVQKLILTIIEGEDSPVNRAFPALIPIPLTLCSYPLTELKDFSDLIDSYWQQIEKKIRGFNAKQLQVFVDAGQYLFIIDGLNEIGNIDFCSHLLTIIGRNAEKYENGFFCLITGRPDAFAFPFKQNLLHHYPGLFPRCTLTPLPEVASLKTKAIFFNQAIRTEIKRLSEPFFSGSTMLTGTEISMEELIDSLVVLLAGWAFHNLFDPQIISGDALQQKDLWQYLISTFFNNGKFRNFKESLEKKIGKILENIIQQSFFFRVGEDGAVKAPHFLLKEFLAAEYIISQYTEQGNIKFIEDLFQHKLSNNKGLETVHYVFHGLKERAGNSNPLFPALNLAYQEHRNFLARELGDTVEERFLLTDNEGLKKHITENRRILLEALIVAEIKSKPRIWIFHILMRQPENYELIRQIWEGLFLNRSWLDDEQFLQFPCFHILFPHLTFLRGNDSPSFTLEELELHLWLINSFCSPVSLDWAVHNGIAARIKEYKPEQLFTGTHHQLLSLAIQTTSYPLPLPSPFLLWQDMYFICPATFSAMQSEGLFELVILRFYYLMILFKIDMPRALDMDMTQARAWGMHRDMKRENLVVIPRALARSRLFSNIPRPFGLIDDLHQSWNMALKVLHTRDVLVARNFARAIVQGIARDLAIHDSIMKKIEAQFGIALQLNQSMRFNTEIKTKTDDLILAALFYLIAYSLSKGVVPSPLKVTDFLDGSETTWQEQMKKLVGFVPVSMEREAANYGPVFKDNFWVANISRVIGRIMRKKGIEEVSLDPDDFFEWFNDMVGQIQQEYLSTAVLSKR